MAKSKNGGTRAYIRGRIGSDVYSVGKNSKGEKQQVVRSLAETVANPRSSSQMFGRMVMSTVMQAVSALKPIIDHSFDGLPVGQPSISEFIRRNYALVKADAIANPSSGNSFGLVKYQEKGVRGGKYIVSNGSAVLPAAVAGNSVGFVINLTAGTMTVGGLKAALGLSKAGYLTWLAILANKKVIYGRLHLTTTLADTTAITSENVASLFTIEANDTFEVSATATAISFEYAGTGAPSNYGTIVSEKVDGAWVHNTCVLAGETDPSYNADAALPTYPVGTEQFLNGGDL